ncbi:MAG: class I SAM-dependent methyltransferase [Chloroflexi bacterium]|nr:class I SAM-dependent methyltransferase [Chloroflexota bacterium]
MIDHITQHTYDNIAPEFARVNATMPEKLIVAMQRFIALVGNSATVLDLGSGTGRDSVYMQSCGLNVVSADFSMGMLSQAKMIGVKNLVQMDMRTISFSDRCFQGVWCCASLLHLPKQFVSGTLTEIHRVLVHQGIFFLAIQVGASEGYEPNPYASPPLERFFARYSQPEIESLLHANSFQVIEPVIAGINKRWIQVHAKAE